jgi:hypothetical protein
VEEVSNELIVRYPELPSDLYGAAQRASTDTNGEAVI